MAVDDDDDNNIDVCGETSDLEESSIPGNCNDSQKLVAAYAAADASAYLHPRFPLAVPVGPLGSRWTGRPPASFPWPLQFRPPIGFNPFAPSKYFNIRSIRYMHNKARTGPWPAGRFKWTLEVHPRIKLTKCP